MVIACHESLALELLCFHLPLKLSGSDSESGDSVVAAGAEGAEGAADTAGAFGEAHPARVMMTAHATTGKATVFIGYSLGDGIHGGY
jgi:hypothetical protein